MTTWNDWLGEELPTDEIEQALEAYLKNEHKDFTEPHDPEIWEKFQEAYCGQYDKFQDFVEEQFRETMEIPDHLTNYLDFEAIARDWQHEFWSSDDGFVFRAH